MGRWMAVFGIGVLIALGVSSNAQTTVLMNGKAMSQDVRIIGGKPYAPLGDVARALGMTLVRKPTAYQIVAAGGAGETRGRYTGKIRSEERRVGKECRL